MEVQSQQKRRGAEMVADAVMITDKSALPAFAMRLV